jgi:soluble lytic murein transglycosylase-like protein
MKTTIGVLMLAATLAGSAVHYKGPDAPSPISVQRVTEKSIKEEVRREQNQKQIWRNVKIAERVYRRLGCRTTYAEATGRIAFGNNISARLLAAVVFVESSCNPNAVSSQGSIGLTQTNYRVWKEHTRKEYLNPELSLETGAKILAVYIHRYGLIKGLHAYNGFGNPSNEYATKVLAAAGIEVKE